MITPIEPAWPARTFVEFESLPDLLVLPGTAAADAPPESWTAWEFWDGCNLEHIEDDDMPADDDMRDFLAADAWQLVSRLQLVSENGLSPAGQRIAGIAGTPAGPAHRNRPATRCVYGPGRAGASLSPGTG